MGFSIVVTHVIETMNEIHKYLVAHLHVLFFDISYPLIRNNLCCFDKFRFFFVLILFYSFFGFFLLNSTSF